MALRQLKMQENQITRRDTGSIEKYLSDISKTEPLSADMEVELARRIKQGDQKAKDQLIKANLRFVVSVAKQYQNNGIPLIDIIQEGNVGLMMAAEKFDETKGFKFISYAVWWIRQSIMASLSNHSKIVRIPQNKTALYLKIKNFVHEYNQKHEHDPLIEVIAEAVGESVDNIVELYVPTSKPASFDKCVSNKEGDEKPFSELVEDAESINPEKELLKKSQREYVRWFLQHAVKKNKIKERDLKVIKLYYGIECEALLVESIAHELNMSGQSIRNIRDNFLHRMKNDLQLKNLAKQML